MTRIDIPAALRDEFAADLATGGERANRWRPSAVMGVTWILALDGPYAGGTGTSTGLSGWEYSGGTQSRLFISADGGGPWQFDLDERPQAQSVTAWAPVGATDRPNGMDLRAANPRPKEGARVLVLDAPTDWLVGKVCTYREAAGEPAVRVDETQDLFYIHRWALLPQPAPRQASAPRTPHPSRGHFATRPWRIGQAWGSKPGANLVTLAEQGTGEPDEQGRRRDDRLIGAVSPADARVILAAVNERRGLRDWLAGERDKAEAAGEKGAATAYTRALMWLASEEARNG